MADYEHPDRVNARQKFGEDECGSIFPECQESQDHFHEVSGIPNKKTGLLENMEKPIGAGEYGRIVNTGEYDRIVNMVRPNPICYATGNSHPEREHDASCYITPDEMAALGGDTSRVTNDARTRYSKKRRVIPTIEELRRPNVVDGDDRPMFGGSFEMNSDYRTLHAMTDPATPFLPPSDDPLGVFEEVRQLVAGKNAAYGDAWKRQGYVGNLARVMSKVERLRNLLWADRTPVESLQLIGVSGQKQAETVEDTLLDLMALAAFMLRNYRENNRWGQPQ